MLAAYTIAITIRQSKRTQFTVGFNGDDYFSDWTNEGFGDAADEMWSEDWISIHVYVFFKSFFQILPFTWFYFLSKHIGQPFKKYARLKRY